MTKPFSNGYNTNKVDLTIRQQWKIHMRKNFRILNGSLALVIYVEWNEMNIAPKIKGKITSTTLLLLLSTRAMVTFIVFLTLYTHCVLVNRNYPHSTLLTRLHFCFISFGRWTNGLGWWWIAILWHIVWWCLSLMCTVYTLQILYSIQWTRWLVALIQR